MNIPKRQKGILLVELIIAVGVFVALASGLLTLSIRSHMSFYQAGDIMFAQNIINERFAELVKAKQEDFSKLSSEAGTDFMANGRKFTRSTAVDPVSRCDLKIVADCTGCAGICGVDNETQKITIKVVWSLIHGKNVSQSAVVYFTKWEP